MTTQSASDAGESCFPADLEGRALATAGQVSVLGLHPIADREVLRAVIFAQRVMRSEPRC